MKTSNFSSAGLARLLAAGLMATITAGLLVACSKRPPPQSSIQPPTELAAVDTPPPDYPIEVACAGIGGTATLRVTVGTEGKPTQVQLVQGSGNEALDKSALERVPTWQFNPRTVNGKPASQTIQIPVSFKPPVERPAECFKLDGGS